MRVEYDSQNTGWIIKYTFICRVAHEVTVFRIDN